MPEPDFLPRHTSKQTCPLYTNSHICVTHHALDNTLTHIQTHTNKKKELLSQQNQAMPPQGGPPHFLQLINQAQERRGSFSRDTLNSKYTLESPGTQLWP